MLRLPRLQLQMLFLVGLCSGLACNVWAASSAFPATLVFDGDKLALCGAAEVKAYKFFLVANSALYRTNCGEVWDVDSVKESRYLQFNYSREVPAHGFRESAEVLLKRNNNFTDETWGEIRKFHEHYRAVVDGDKYIVFYQPGSGLSLWLNGELLANTADVPWAASYFSIWLGADPFSNSLKRDLLGSSR